MIRSIRTPHHALALAFAVCLALIAGVAATQGDPMQPTRFPPDALVGEWAIEFPNPGGPRTIGTVSYRPDGSYEETLIMGEEIVGWWRGTYTLAPDGTLALNEIENSPDLCFAGQCEPNDPPTPTVARLDSVVPTSYTATYVEDGGMPATLTFQRVGGGMGASPTGPGGPDGGAGGGAGGGSADGAPGVTTVPATPMTPGADGEGPVAPDDGAAGANPLRATPTEPPPGGAGATAAEPDPWLGTWSDGDVTIRFDLENGVSLHVGGAEYPMRLWGDDRRLDGTFDSGGQSYEIALERAADTVTVTSGGASYLLQREGGAPGSGNPLGGN